MSKTHARIHAEPAALCRNSRRPFDAAFRNMQFAKYNFACILELQMRVPKTNLVTGQQNSRFYGH